VKCSYDGSTTLNTGTNYKVAVTNHGSGNFWYSSTANYWSSGAGSGGITSGPITAPNDGGADGGQDTFITPSTVLAYPTTSFNATNYWIDVEVTATPPPPPPTVPVLYSMRSFP
jgi:hypothetical protein